MYAHGLIKAFGERVGGLHLQNITNGMNDHRLSICTDAETDYLDNSSSFMQIVHWSWVMFLNTASLTVLLFPPSFY